MVFSGETGPEGHAVPEGKGVSEGEGQVTDEPDDGAPGVFGEFRDSLTELAAQVAREHDRAQARESVIDRLHSEVERLRAGEVRSLLRPTVTDLRLLRDDLAVQARSVPEGMTRGEVAALLESYADSVALILERCGVLSIRPVALETKFDPREQQVVGVVGTDQADLDGIVADVVSDGYADADTGRPVAPAKVKVFRTTADQLAGDGQPNGQDL